MENKKKDENSQEGSREDSKEGSKDDEVKVRCATCDDALAEILFGKDGWDGEDPDIDSEERAAAVESELGKENVRGFGYFGRKSCLILARPRIHVASNAQKQIPYAYLQQIHS